MSDYSLTMYGHCGMPIPIVGRDDLASARERAARIIRRLRQRRMFVTTLDKGQTWESTEPDDAVMISDWSGILCLREYPYPYRCPECDQGYEDGEDAWRCCQGGDCD